MHEACAALGGPVLTHETYEADHIIGTLVAQARAAGFDAPIVTGDRDGVSVFNPRGPARWYDADGVRAKFGVWPSR